MVDTLVLLALYLGTLPIVHATRETDTRPSRGAFSYTTWWYDATTEYSSEGCDPPPLPHAVPVGAPDPLLRGTVLKPQQDGEKQHMVDQSEESDSSSQQGGQKEVVQQQEVGSTEESEDPPPPHHDDESNGVDLSSSSSNNNNGKDGSGDDGEGDNVEGRLKLRVAALSSSEGVETTQPLVRRPQTSDQPQQEGQAGRPAHLFAVLEDSTDKSTNNNTRNKTLTLLDLKSGPNASNPSESPGQPEGNLRLRAQEIMDAVQRDDNMISTAVHTFYYPWYGNPTIDGEWHHWNHQYIPHWRPDVAAKYPTGHHKPPDDIGAAYYPLLGPYSSSDPTIITEHLSQIREAGIGVLVVSWYPLGTADDEGKEPDKVTRLLLDAAEKVGLEVAIHIEPYPKRTPTTVRTDVEYILHTYGSHKALHRQPPSPRSRKALLESSSTSNVTNNHSQVITPRLPVIYVYDSYLSSANAWKELLDPGASRTSLSIRGTEYDCVVLGLVVEAAHMAFIEQGGFDGIYTYFASTGFSYASTWSNWGSIAKFAKPRGLLWVPSVGPGYVDTPVRPWNGANAKERQNGKYYDQSWQHALDSSPDVVSITSFNEWHEGTQIEPAVPRGNYMSYLPENPRVYLKRTAKWVRRWNRWAVTMQGE